MSPEAGLALATPVVVFVLGLLAIGSAYRRRCEHDGPRLSRRFDAPEVGCDRVTNPSWRRAIAPRTLAMKLRIPQLNRQGPGDRFC
jgi:hypothetical protein